MKKKEFIVRIDETYFYEIMAKNEDEALEIATNNHHYQLEGEILPFDTEAGIEIVERRRFGD